MTHEDLTFLFAVLMSFSAFGIFVYALTKSMDPNKELKKPIS